MNLMFYLVNLLFKGDSVITINEKKRQNEEHRLMFNLQNNIDGFKKVRNFFFF